MKYFEECFSKLADLESFDYRAFIPDEKVSRNLCGFVLSLALIHTDIKDLSLFLKLVLQSKPEGSFQIRKDWGEFNGIVNHLNRLHMGILHELFNLIERNKKILEDGFFIEVIKSMKKENADYWVSLVEASLNKASSKKVTEDLMKIRNKISFHYDHKIILNGYKFLYDQRIFSERAFISRGNSMEESRFYFADGAAESYIISLGDKKDTNSIFAPIRELLIKLNISIRFIVINFIQKRGFGFKKVI